MDIKMGLHQGLHMKRQIVMTQRLQQALKLLQVSTLELEQILRTELEANPLLEEADPDEDPEDVSDRDDVEAAPDKAETTVEVTGEDVDWDEYFKDGFRGAATEQGFDDDDQLERPPVYIPSDQEHVLDQLHLSVRDERQREIGEYIIGCLNESGFLAAPLADEEGGPLPLPAGEDLLVLKYSVFCHDLGKPATRSTGADGRVHFYVHEKVSVHRMRDMAIALDGLNELQAAKQLPSYPAAFPTRSIYAQLVSSNAYAARDAALLTLSSERAAGWTEPLVGGPLRYSMLAHLVWRNLVNRYEASAAELRSSMEEAAAQSWEGIDP